MTEVAQAFDVVESGEFFMCADKDYAVFRGQTESGDPVVFHVGKEGIGGLVDAVTRLASHWEGDAAKAD